MTGGFFDLSAQKSATQAVLFYLACVVSAAMLVGITTSALVSGPPDPSAKTFQEGFDKGFVHGVEVGKKIGGPINLVLSLGLSLAIIRLKKLNTPLEIICAVASAASSFLLGAVGGFIAPAWLTTRPVVKDP